MRYIDRTQAGLRLVSVAAFAAVAARDFGTSWAYRRFREGQSLLVGIFGSGLSLNDLYFGPTQRWALSSQNEGPMASGMLWGSNKIKGAKPKPTPLALA